MSAGKLPSVRAGESASLLLASSRSDERAERRVLLVSIAANVVLTVLKTAVVARSRSLAVLASLLDSVLDLVSQIVLWAAARLRKSGNNDLYPAGRARLEPVSVVVCSMLMGVSAMGIIAQSIGQLLLARIPPPAIGDYDLYVMIVAVVSKTALYAWIARCLPRLRETSSSVAAVAQDHFNDVLSNAAAIVSAAVASHGLAWFDPAGAIAISTYIAFSWLQTGTEQIEQLVGKSADPSFLDELREISSVFHESIACDIVRAYHFGPRFLVELEMVMDANTRLRDSHDVAMALQQTIESMPDVERCFVHVDYERRPYDEHDASTSPRTNLKQQQLQPKGHEFFELDAEDRGAQSAELV